MTEVEIAERIAREAHAGQKEESTGDDYIHHIERVVALVDGDKAKAVAWLHDVLEDSDFSASELGRAGISEPVLDAVRLLTREDNETSMVIQTYSQYIEGIRRSKNVLALAVKRADLQDHLRPNCPPRLRPRYERALETLTADPLGDAVPRPQDSVPVETLRGIVAQWRKEAASELAMGDQNASATLDACADQLEACYTPKGTL